MFFRARLPGRSNARGGIDKSGPVPYYSSTGARHPERSIELRLKAEPLNERHWRPAARLTRGISRELGVKPSRSLAADLAIYASPWLENGEGFVLTGDKELFGLGWARAERTRGRDCIHTGLYLAPPVRSPDRYRILTDPLMESAYRLARDHNRDEACTYYLSIDTIHPPIARALGFQDLPAVMIGFQHDLVRIPDAPVPAGITVRPARLPEELPRLIALAQRCFDDPELQGDPGHKDNWDLLAGEFAAHPEQLLVADAGGRSVGYLMLTIDQAPAGAARIDESGVLPEWRRRGISTYLTCRALRYSRRRKLRRVVISEYSTSPAGALLWRLGFRPDALRTFHFFGRPLR